VIKKYSTAFLGAQKPKVPGRNLRDADVDGIRNPIDDLLTYPARRHRRPV
jgi:hypothetical protein